MKIRLFGYINGKNREEKVGYVRSAWRNRLINKVWTEIELPICRTELAAEAYACKFPQKKKHAWKDQSNYST